MRLKLASRKSDLARWQAVTVARSLERLPEKPDIEFIFKASKGDQDQDTALSAMGAKGVFTEDLHNDLVSGVCDLVVHSWKDLPVEDQPDTHIAMTLQRADMRDILLVPEEVWAETLNSGRLEILTSSPRRVYNLQNSLRELLPGTPELEFVNVRGNVPTRLAKMRDQKRALVIAKAGLDRLLAAEGEGFLQEGHRVRELIRDCRLMVLPLQLNPSAPAQGALAVEVVRENEALNALCASLSDEGAFFSVQKEREILRQYGGGCHQKIGASVFVRDFGRLISIRGMTDQGEILNTWKIDSPVAWERARSAAQVYPLRAQEVTWFNRRPLKVSADLSSRQALFISRTEALPEGFTPGANQIVWTAGLKTWRKLAQLGIWVNGSTEGLGDREDPRLENMRGALRWTKLTHSRAGERPGGETIATYELRPREEHPDLQGKTHFFWTSTTAFECARQLFPELIRDGHNAAGPGATFDHLRRVSGLKHAPKAFIDLDQFLSETLPKD